VCEGEKKALALAQRGLPVIGIGGIEAWHARGSRTLLPDFAPIRLMAACVEIVPDSDFRSNRTVEQAVSGLATALGVRGARARVVLLPDVVRGVNPDKVGADDYLEAGGRVEDLPRTDPPDPHCTALGNSERLIRQHGADVRFLLPFRSWFGWTETHWKRDPGDGIAERAKLTTRAIYREASELADPARRKALGAWAAKDRERARTARDARARQKCRVVAPEQLDRHLGSGTSRTAPSIFARASSAPSARRLPDEALSSALRAGRALSAGSRRSLPRSSRTTRPYRVAAEGPGLSAGRG
jgi:hypothetical protein